ncbi:MAG: glycosyltransferase family 4 protein [Desulfotomaculum sp.]|nr:glycosyltransferase family 4 protein [Desulfotomaculum sp.]
MSKIKVLHLIRPAAGGMKKHLLDLVRYTDRKQFEVEVAVPEDCSYKQELRQMEVKILPVSLAGNISPIYDWRAIWYLAHYLKKNKIIILHTHGSKAALVGRMAALFAGTPVVLFTVHNSIFYDHWSRWKKKFMAETEKLLAKKTDKIITVSNQLRRQVVEVEKIPEDKVVTIYNGINLREIDSHASKRKLCKSLGLPPLGRIVGVVARLAPQKGVVYFIKAASLLKEYRANFVVIGDGPLRNELEIKIKKLGLQDRVFLAGYRSDIFRLLPALDIFVLPSLTEGLPLTILEAMAAARPVVATKVGGVPELINQGITGLLVEPGNPGELAGAIAELLENPSRAKELGIAGKKIVSENFCIDSMIEATMKLYKELLNDKGISRGCIN